MNHIVKLHIFAIIFCLLSGIAMAITLEEVSNELVCLCGCGLVLTNCNHIDCGMAIPMRAEIKDRIAEGETKEEIIASFVSSYGEAVLAVPPKRGFNLTVWLLPFIGIAAGGGFVVFLITVWFKRRSRLLKQAPIPKAVTSHQYDTVFERELKEFE